MGTIISKDTRRISFDNTISVNPILIQKSYNDNDDIGFDDFNELSKTRYNKSRFTENTIYVDRMHDEEQEYWTRRIDDLKNEHKLINSIIEKEYEKTIERNEKMVEPQNITKEKLQNLKPCLTWRTKLLQCYEDNPRQPLLCSSVVQAFSNCVASCQLNE